MTEKKWNEITNLLTTPFSEISIVLKMLSYWARVFVEILSRLLQAFIIYIEQNTQKKPVNEENT